MNDSYTPTTEEVRTAAHNKAFFPLFHDTVDFDRWLAAHDAEKRAEWEAEQGERRPCRLPHTAPPCTTCHCGSRETWDAARGRALAEQGEVEWEYGCRSSAHIMSDYRDQGALVLQDREHAEEHGYDCPSPSTVRRPRAGGWEMWVPVSDESIGDPLDCPGCGYDPMAPHNGKGDCAPNREDGGRNDD